MLKTVVLVIVLSLITDTARSTMVTGKKQYKGVEWSRDRDSNKWYEDTADIPNRRVYGGRQHPPEEQGVGRSDGVVGRSLNILAGVLLILSQIVVSSALYILMGWNIS